MTQIITSEFQCDIPAVFTKVRAVRSELFIASETPDAQTGGDEDAAPLQLALSVEPAASRRGAPDARLAAHRDSVIAEMKTLGVTGEITDEAPEQILGRSGLRFTFGGTQSLRGSDAKSAIRLIAVIAPGKAANCMIRVSVYGDAHRMETGTPPAADLLEQALASLQLPKVKVSGKMLKIQMKNLNR